MKTIWDEILIVGKLKDGMRIIKMYFTWMGMKQLKSWDEKRKYAFSLTG